MPIAKIFESDGSQAIRLPKEFEFDSDEVQINKIGRAIVIYPKGSGWDIMEESLSEFPEDVADNVPDEARDKNRPS